MIKSYEVVKWLVKAGADTQDAAHLSRGVGASAEQTAYLEAKTHCSSLGCSGAGVKKCTGCRQVRYCETACQLAHWKAHKADCKRVTKISDIDVVSLLVFHAPDNCLFRMKYLSM
jgi:hypothetical protein